MIGAVAPMPKRRRGLLGALILILPLAFSIGATQFIAARPGHHTALGRPVIGPLYVPWGWLSWHAQFRRSAPQSFALVHAAAGMLGIAGSLAGLLALGLRGRTAQRHEGVHGTAHWGTRAEIEATGPLPSAGRRGAGVYVGGWRDDRGRLHYLRHNGPEHIAAIAPTRSGKGVGLVVPTLLSWPHSLVSTTRKPSCGI
jgi:type IV secretion system protein VirD4